MSDNAAFETHNLGDAVRIHNIHDPANRYYGSPFTDAINGGTIDPDVVTVLIKQPDGTIGTFTYSEEGTDIVRAGEGSYYIDIDANQSGTWFYRWRSTGNGQAAEERRFIVRDAQAVEA